MNSKFIFTMKERLQQKIISRKWDSYWCKQLYNNEGCQCEWYSGSSDSIWVQNVSKTNFISKYLLVELVGVACLVGLVLIVMFDAKVLTTIIAMPLCNCRTSNTHSYRVVIIIIMSSSI